MHTNQPNPLPSGDNANIIQSFKSIAQMTGQASQVMNFPPIDHDSPIRYVPGYFLNLKISQIAIVLTPASISEYDITKNIFVNSHPWLFPGGIGNMYDLTHRKVSIKEWGYHLLRYYDGCFLKYSLFGLFLYNTVQRHTSNSEGNFFLALDQFIGRNPPTNQELQRQVLQKNCRYISMLRYFAQNIKGVTTTGIPVRTL